MERRMPMKRIIPMLALLALLCACTVPPQQPEEPPAQEPRQEAPLQNEKQEEPTDMAEETVRQPGPTEGLSEEQKAIYDIAMAYYDKGALVQYCDRQLTYLGTKGPLRAADLVTPEAATSQSILYSMCSKFTFEIFYEAFQKPDGTHYQFGRLPVRKYHTYYLIKLAQPDSAYYNPDITVRYWQNPGQDRENVRQELLDTLEPGDVLIYKSKDSGHTLLYLGGDLVINSTAHRRENIGTGGSYDYKNHRDITEPNGTVGLTSLLDDVLAVPSSLTKAFSKYVLAANITDLAILRPLDEIRQGGYELTPAARNRRALSRLSTEKTASVEKFETVNPGDTITYTVTLKSCDENAAFSGVELRDQVPEGTRLLEAGDGCRAEGNLLTWYVDVPALQSVSVSFTVEVTAEPGSVITACDGSVGGLPLAGITTRVASTLTPAQQALLQERAVSVAAASSDMPGFLAALYREVTGQALNLPDAEALLDAFFDRSEVDTAACDSNCLRSAGNNGVYPTFSMKPAGQRPAELDAMYVPGLFGGLYTTGCEEPIYYDGRAIWFHEKLLLPGDVLALYNDDAAAQYAEYLYLGQNTWLRVEGSFLYLLRDEEGAALTDSLPGANCYLVLRPSMANA